MATPPPQDCARALSPELVIEHPALFNSRNNVIEELDWFLSEFSSVNVNDEATYYQVFAIKEQIELLKYRYEKIHEQIQLTIISLEEVHSIMIKKFFLFITKANASLKAFEDKLTRNQIELSLQQSPQPAAIPQFINLNLQMQMQFSNPLTLCISTVECDSMQSLQLHLITHHAGKSVGFLNRECDSRAITSAAPVTKGSAVGSTWCCCACHEGRAVGSTWCYKSLSTLWLNI